MKKQDKDLHAYEIGSEVLDRIDIHNGTLVTYHQNHRDSKNYLKNLEAIQYDLLYGKQYLYGGKSPFKPIDLKMGVNKIKITEVIKTADKYFIKGQNFTENSKVNLNGKILDTEYIGPTILEVKEKVTPDDISKMKISQVEGDKEILSTSE